MQKSDYPYLADWIAITLRWLALLGIAATLALSTALNQRVYIALLLPVLWNLFNTVLALLNRRLTNQRTFNVVEDFFASILLFMLSGGHEGPLIWSGLLALLSGAIYFEILGGLLVGLALSLFQAIWIFLTDPAGMSLNNVGVLIGFNLAAGILLGMLGRYLMRGVRSQYQSHLNEKDLSGQKIQQKERDRLQLFYSMIETLSSTLNYELVLETSLDLGLAALDSSHSEKNPVVGAVMLFEDDTLTVGATRHMPPRDMKVKLPAEQGVLAEIFKSGEAKKISNPGKDPELGQFAALQDCESAVCLPLHRGLNSFGVLFFGHPDVYYFKDEQTEILEMISHQAVIAIQNARLYKELEIEKERIISSQEEAQKKLARDLHDGPTQTISSIAMEADIARKMLETKPESVREELDKIENMARRATQEIRHMLFKLRPLVLESQGLAPALEAMAEKMRDIYQQNVEVQTDPLVIEKLEESRQTVLFHLAEEAVNNARKHAQASLINVRLRPHPKGKDLALLEIIDNGVGFDVEDTLSSYEKRNSLGMVNLRERVNLINGLLHIDSATGKGAHVYILIPLSDDAADRIQRGVTS